MLRTVESGFTEDPLAWHGDDDYSYSFWGMMLSRRC